LGSSTQLLVVLSEEKKSVGFLRLPHLQEVHLKNIEELANHFDAFKDGICSFMD
jgi:hypothetical protein